ncbi:16345_t:CDS:2 [Entrophospora sp. SA101]|nr:16345_t:CDS:2 [Entrophospora sp. SA101]
MRMNPLTKFIKCIRSFCDIQIIDIIVISEIAESNIYVLREAGATLLVTHRESMKKSFIFLMDHLYKYYSRPGKGIIKFYNRDEPYYEFTNFYSPKNNILIEGVYWQTTEHYFQAAKFKDPLIRLKIQYAKSAREAFTIARSHDLEKRVDWELVLTEERTIFKELIMKNALKSKFKQFPNLQFKLLSTCDAEIIEHTQNDRYWGDGGNGEGLNRLGQLLKEVRTEIFQTERNRLILENGLGGGRYQGQRWIIHHLQCLNHLSFDGNNSDYNL